MKIFSYCYDRTLVLAAHPKANYYLAFISFIEAIIFPIPADVMLAPMVLAKPKKAWQLAFITTAFSVLGGILGYALGLWAFDLVVEPTIEWLNYTHHYDKITAWFAEYGIWVIFLAGFTPIPYKIFTVAAGAFMMSFIPFMVMSFISRGARYFLVAALVAWGGPKFEEKLRTYVDTIGWTTIALAILAYLLLQYTS